MSIFLSVDSFFNLKGTCRAEFDDHRGRFFLKSTNINPYDDRRMPYGDRRMIRKEKRSNPPVSLSFKFI